MQWTIFVLYLTQISLWLALKGAYIYISFTYIYSLIRSMSMLYCQYIDDIIMIWKGNYGDLTNVLHNINKQQQTIKPDFGI